MKPNFNALDRLLDEDSELIHSIFNKFNLMLDLCIKKILSERRVRSGHKMSD